MYLRISNRGSLNRKFLELIGFTSKRERVEDISVIGNKGSGTKLAAVAALRLGLKLAIASSDYLGRYILTFDVEEVEVDEGVKARQIFLNYRNIRREAGRNMARFKACERARTEHVRYPWSMTVDAFQDWDQPIGDDKERAFKVLREFICNAYDEDKDMGLSFSEHVGFAKPGQTTVYLLFTKDVRRVLFDQAGRYFKFLLREPKKHVVPGFGEIYTKSDDREVTRLFLLGVLVDCSTAYFRRSIYDYSLYKKSLLSEERIIKNWNDFRSELGNMLASLTSVAMAKTLLAYVLNGEAKLEASALASVPHVADTSAAVWKEVITDHYGTEKVCLPSLNRVTDGDAEQIYGYVVARDTPDDFRGFLRTLGYPNARDVVPQQPEYDRVRFSDLDEESKQRFRRAFRRFARHFPMRAKLPIVIFHAKDDRVRERILGYAGLGDKSFQEIWIAAKTPTALPSELSIFGTMVHEGRHVVTKAGDYDRVFVEQAEKDVLLSVLRADGRTTLPDGSPMPAMGDADMAVPNLVDPDAIATGTGTSPKKVAADTSPSPIGDDIQEEIDRALDEIIKMTDASSKDPR